MYIKNEQQHNKGYSRDLNNYSFSNKNISDIMENIPILQKQ